MQSLNLENKNVITARDFESLIRNGLSEITVKQGAVLTSSARELLQSADIKVTRVAGSDEIVPAPGRGASVNTWSRGSRSPEAIFRSPEAMAIREEIVRVGHKLWKRGFVDGNGGNISYRLNDEYALCSPTLLSKGDLTVEDLCMVDMEGRQVAGKKIRTSEILLHLAIYKGVPKARSCVHAHPPHATAYAITGLVPPINVIPEAEIFVGVVAFSPYDTPGTTEIADRVVPLAKNHNTILLGNHGLICWADTPTHAEWCVEVVDSYCQVLILASQIGAPINKIPENKALELMKIKKSLDLPDPRLSGEECKLSDSPDLYHGIAVCPRASSPSGASLPGPCGLQGTANCPGTCKKEGCRGTEDMEPLIQKITDQVMAALKAS